MENAMENKKTHHIDEAIQSSNIMELYFRNNCAKDTVENEVNDLPNKNNILKKNKRTREDDSAQEQK